ncbi:uridine kinase family protein [Halobacillus massiliensis]|uniref:uridine kinase family protein n=1 Tax=Halobacillus massiliensis TaxID=1926286 RepID=UPI0009E33F88|nr:AAA family ATPase [Halobacillus massiliensis]
MIELPMFNKKLVTIGIDGCGGAGKSTLAEKIARMYPTSTIVHMDDFYLPLCERKVIHEVGGNFDYQRVIHQVIKPLIDGKESSYQRYDWDLDEMAEWHTVEPNGCVIIEGCYSTRNEMRDYYDYTIWVETPEAVRLKRGLERDGNSALPFWQEWMAEENQYIKEQQPREKVDHIVSGI